MFSIQLFFYACLAFMNLNETFLFQANDETAREKNSCALVWEGQVKTRTFGTIIFKMCPTAVFAREHFKKLGVEQYWDIAQSDVILQMADN